jgi:hypothetical protein
VRRRVISVFVSAIFLLGAGIQSTQAATRLIVTGSSTQTAGTIQNLTITAVDDTGKVDSSYSGNKNVVFTGASASPSPSSTPPTVMDRSGTAKTFGQNTSLTFTFGVATVAAGENGVMTLYNAEVANIAAREGSIPFSTGPDRLTVTVSPAALNTFAVSLTSPQISGAAFTGTNTITAQDEFSNTITTFNAATTPVTVTTALTGTISGLGSGNNNVLNRLADFSSGVADVTGELTFTGPAATGTFTATGGGKNGTSGNVTITVVPTRLVITGSGAQTAGSQNGLTITARDANGNIATGYTGSKSLTFSGANPSTSPVTQPSVENSGGTQIPFGSLTAINFSNGVAVSGATNGVMRLYLAETATIAVTDGSISAAGADRLTVVVSPGSLEKFNVSLTSPQTSGAAFTGTNTITAQDNWGNTITNFNAAAANVAMTSTLTGTISGLGSGNTNVLNQSSDFTSGVANLTGEMIFTGPSGTGTFTATGGGKNGTSGNVTITVLATRLVITGNGTQTAGTTQSLTITARDGNGNIATGYAGSKNLTFSGANASTHPITQPTVTNNAGAQVQFGSTTAILFTSGVANAIGGNNGVMRLYKAENATIAVTDGSISAAGADRLPVVVSPGVLGQFDVSLSTPQTNGVAFTGTNTITAQDDFGNTITNFSAATTNVTVTSTLTGTITGLGSGNTNVLNQLSDFSTGVANVTGKLKFTGTPGTGTFTATGGTKNGTSGSVVINAGAAARLVITGSGTQTAGTTQNLTITARDSSGSIATGYTGTRNLTFSGANPSINPVRQPTVENAAGTQIPFGSLTAISFSNGVATVSGGNNGVMRLYKAETAKISVTDGTISSGTPDQLSVDVSAGPLEKFVVSLSSPQISGTAFTGTNTIAAQDSFANPIINYNAAISPVTVTTTLTGTITGLGSGNNNVLNQFSDFVSGVANVAGKLKYTGTIGTGTFTATVAGKNGTSGNVAINAGAAARLVITGSAAQTAGASQNLTITAKDSAGNTDLSYAGNKNLLFSGASSSTNPVQPPTVIDRNGAAIAFGSPTSLAFTSGVASVSTGRNGVMTLYKAESAIISVTDGSIGSSGTDRLPVTVSPGVLGKFVISLTSPQTNGVAFTGTNTIAAQDSFGNPITNFNAATDNVTVTSVTLPGTITGLGSSGTNVLNQASDFTNGVANVALKMKFSGTSGTGTFRATSASGKLGTSSNVVINNPAPMLLSINPTNGNRSDTINVTLNGTELFPTSTSNVSMGNGITVDTLLGVTPTQITARIMIGAGASLGTRNVSLTNPTPGGGVSTLTNAFTVTNTPTLFSVNPASGVRGQTMDVVLTGKNFQDGISSVNIGGTGIVQNSFTVNSSTQITINITISLTASTGPRTFTVTNSGTGGGTSNGISFTVGSNPAPTVTAIAPAFGNRLQTLEVTVTGTNFFNGITSLSLGPGITVGPLTFDNLTQIRSNITISDTAASGLRNVVVVNAAPGGGTDTLKNGFEVRNPAPTLTAIAPNSGNRLQSLPVVFSGTNFIQGVSTVNVGSGITVDSIRVSSPTALTASITILSGAATGPRSFSVTNPTPGGGTSATQTFTVGNPASLIDSIAPANRTVGDPGFTLTVFGAGFVPETVVRLDSMSRATTFVSPTQLTAAILPGDQDTARMFDVSAFTQGTGSSNAVPLTVNNPVPTLASVTPDSGTRLQTATLAFTGTNFVPGFSTVVFDPPADITVDSVSVAGPTQMTARVTIESQAAIGPRTVAIVNPSPGGGSSGTIPFTIAANPAPSLVSVSPSVGNRLQTLHVVLTGQNFISNTVTSVSFGNNISVDSLEVNSPTQITVRITIGVSAATGLRSVTVTNAGPGGGVSTLPNAFQVNNPAPILLNIDPSNGDQLQTLDVSFWGFNFIEGVTQVNMGSGITINPPFVIQSDTLFTANITISANAAIGPRNVSVFNIGPGGGTSTLTNGFVVGNNPSPTVISVSPSGGTRLQTMNVVVRGSNFLGGVTSVDMGPNIVVNSTTVDSASQLTANITIGATAALGTRTVIVTNRPPGGGVDSLPSAFTITNPLPTLLALTPTTGRRGETLDVGFTGTGFLQGVSTINFGSDVIINTATTDSLTHFTVNITIGSTAALGTRSVSFSNPAPGGGTSGSLAFTVNVALPATVTLLQPGDAATNVDVAPTLSWNPVVDATSYHLQVSTSSSFSPQIVNDSTITGTSRQIGPLTENTTYYWRVRARNANGSGNFSVARSFATRGAYPAVYSLNTTVTFPTYPSASDYSPSEYRMVGLPGANITTISSLLTGTQGVDWQVYVDNGAASNFFVVWGGASVTRFSPGQGFWLIRRGPWVVNTSVPTASLDGSGAVKVPLHSGWNQITNPFINPISWAQVQAENGLVNTVILRYDGGFDTSATMAPYTGYYFDNTTNIDTLRVPYSAVFAPPTAPGDDPIAWKVDIALTSGTFVDHLARLGVAQDAREEIDPLDQRKPRAPGRIPAVYFNRSQWDSAYAVCAADIRPGVHELESWRFDVRVLERAQSHLSFSGVSSVPPQFSVCLVDERSAKSIDLRADSSYTFMPQTEVSHFAVLVGTQEAVQRTIDELQPKAFALGNNYPNPFNPSTSIPVELPHTADIALRVYNILGEEVRTLFSGTLAAGRYTFEWDGKSNHGSAVASGVYLYRMTTVGGQSFVKKMVLTK